MGYYCSECGGSITNAKLCPGGVKIMETQDSKSVQEVLQIAGNLERYAQRLQSLSVKHGKVLDLESQKIWNIANVVRNQVIT